MPYRFEKILVATQPDDIMAALRTLSCMLGRSSSGIWVAIKGYSFAVGPPISGVKGTRWFANTCSEYQMWLPFPKFEPVRLDGIYDSFHPKFGEGHVVCYRAPLGRGRDRETTFNVNQTEGQGRLIAIAAYNKVEVPTNPFHNQRSTQSQQPRRQSDGSHPQQWILPELCVVLRLRGVQLAIESEIGNTFGVPVYLDTERGEIACSNGDVLAEVYTADYEEENDAWTIDVGILGSSQRLCIQVPNRELNRAF